MQANALNTYICANNEDRDTAFVPSKTVIERLWSVSNAGFEGTQ